MDLLELSPESNIVGIGHHTLWQQDRLTYCGAMHGSTSFDGVRGPPVPAREKVKAVQLKPTARSMRSRSGLTVPA